MSGLKRQNVCAKEGVSTNDERFSDISYQP